LENKNPTPAEISLGETAGMTMMHCHPAPEAPDEPGGAGFSPGDLLLATWFRLKRTVVVSELEGEPVTYRMEGFDGISSDASEGSLKGDMISSRVNEVFHSDEVDFAISKASMHGRFGEEPSDSFLFAVQVHATLRKVAKEFALTYSADWEGPLGDTDRRGTLDDAMEIAGIS
jgi:hypothetical protein